MLLYEYEALEVFRNYGIKTEPASLARTPEEAFKAAEKIPPPYMVKAQVRVSGRGKAGGIKPAETPDEVKLVAEQLIGTEIKGETVQGVLVSHRVQVEGELYLSLLTDRYSRNIVAVSSPQGGVDIEELARKNPSSILKIQIDPHIGVKPYHALRISKHLGVDNQVERIIRSMYNILVEYNAKLVEINPLVLTPEGLIAVDRRMIIDDSAIPFNPKLTRFLEARKAEKSQEELIAEECGFSYIPLRGDIGVIGNGAGLTMATMDLIQQRGGRPGCFLDIGGGASSERVEKALKILLENSLIKVILVNVLGGITRCDEVARGIVKALQSSRQAKPVVVRLAGTKEDEGKIILRDAGIPAFREIEPAVLKTVEVARSGCAS